MPTATHSPDSSANSQTDGRYELVATTTPDVVRLHGIYRTPETSCQSQNSGNLPVDGAIILHGLGGNFYSSNLNLRIAESLVQMGISTVLANTRGHDGISMNTVSGRAKTIGAAFEIVDDCRFDVHGWINWMEQRGHRRIALVGHSLGAIKSLYAQACEPHALVTAIIALSATRLSHQRFIASDSRDVFLNWFGQAQKLVSSGRGQELLNVQFPFPTWICASAYVDKYGPQERYNWIALADKISVPTCLIFGELELRDNPAFQGLRDEMDTYLSSLSNFSLNIIDGADHFYAGVHHRACQAISDWLANIHHTA